MNTDPLPYATPAQADPQPRRNTGRAVFGVVVRTVGLLVTLYGVLMLTVVINLMLGITNKGRLADLRITEGGVAVLAGVALLRGGWLVRLAYGRDAE